MSASQHCKIVRLRNPLPQLPGVRCVISPDNGLVVDVHRKLPCERPLYVGVQAETFRRILNVHLPDVWWGEAIDVPADMTARVAAQYHKAVIDTLGLLNKSRALVLGVDAVADALACRELSLVVIAGDASPRDQRRIAREADREGLAWHRFADRNVLGNVFRRKAQVYIGVRHHPLQTRLQHFLQCNTGFAYVNGL